MRSLKTSISRTALSVRHCTVIQNVWDKSDSFYQDNNWTRSGLAGKRSANTDVDLRRSKWQYYDKHIIRPYQHFSRDPTSWNRKKIEDAVKMKETKYEQMSAVTERIRKLEDAKLEALKSEERRHTDRSTQSSPPTEERVINPIATVIKDIHELYAKICSPHFTEKRTIQFQERYTGIYRDAIKHLCALLRAVPRRQVESQRELLIEAAYVVCRGKPNDSIIEEAAKMLLGWFDGESLFGEDVARPTIVHALYVFSCREQTEETRKLIIQGLKRCHELQSLEQTSPSEGRHELTSVQQKALGGVVLASLQRALAGDNELLPAVSAMLSGHLIGTLRCIKKDTAEQRLAATALVQYREQRPASIQITANWLKKAPTEAVTKVSEASDSGEAALPQPISERRVQACLHSIIHHLDMRQIVSNADRSIPEVNSISTVLAEHRIAKMVDEIIILLDHTPTNSVHRRSAIEMISKMCLTAEGEFSEEHPGLDVLMHVNQVDLLFVLQRLSAFYEHLSIDVVLAAFKCGCVMQGPVNEDKEGSEEEIRRQRNASKCKSIIINHSLRALINEVTRAVAVNEFDTVTRLASTVTRWMVEHNYQGRWPRRLWELLLRNSLRSGGANAELLQDLVVLRTKCNDPTVIDLTTMPIGGTQPVIESPLSMNDATILREALSKINQSMSASWSNPNPSHDALLERTGNDEEWRDSVVQLLQDIELAQ